MDYLTINQRLFLIFPFSLTYENEPHEKILNLLSWLLGASSRGLRVHYRRGKPSISEKM